MYPPAVIDSSSARLSSVLRIRELSHQSHLRRMVTHVLLADLASASSSSDHLRFRIVDIGGALRLRGAGEADDRALAGSRGGSRFRWAGASTRGPIPLSLLGGAGPRPWGGPCGREP